MCKNHIIVRVKYSSGNVVRVMFSLTGITVFELEEGAATPSQVVCQNGDYYNVLDTFDEILSQMTEVKNG